MNILATIFGIMLIVVILQDSFETVILPRKVSHRFRLSRLFYASAWNAWSFVARRMRPGNRREFYLSYFGPLSLILLLVMWAIVLIVAFALLQWGLESPLLTVGKGVNFGTYLYLSGTTFITLGLGDIVPGAELGRFLTVFEAGMGFGFLALIIGYVPVIYQAFSHREAAISLLDARAGSPSSATELLRRHFRNHDGTELLQYLHDWEKWCAELLESHLSYPVLTYYRSQHERQSWLAALTTILDTCALLLVGIDDVNAPSIRFTFAIARHAAVDLAQLFETPPRHADLNRLSSADFQRMREALADVGLKLYHEEDAEQRLYDLRLIYEPFVNALANHLLVTLPPWVIAVRTVDDWQTSAWDHFAQWSPAKIEEITHIIARKRHFPFGQKQELEGFEEKLPVDTN